ncbi:nucleotide kinase domain-containing protein [Rhizobium sp. CB3060]|uniref:nucleotide kinase domain-containing protein n=1 Tax=Rhizobium sp. CB3060 TaxID=3138255 RepID=UPI0040544336
MPIRVLDRASQFLIQQVIYNEGLSDSSAATAFRILLFRFYNKIETWESRCRRCRPHRKERPLFSPFIPSFNRPYEKRVHVHHGNTCSGI